MSFLRPVLRAAQSLVLSLPLCLLAVEGRADSVVVTREGAAIRPDGPFTITFKRGRAFRILSEEDRWVEVEWFEEGRAIRGRVSKEDGRIEGPRFRITGEEGEIEVRAVPATSGESYPLVREEGDAYVVAFALLGRNGEGLIGKAMAEKTAPPPEKELPKPEPAEPESKRPEEKPPLPAGEEDRLRDERQRGSGLRILSLPFLLLGGGVLFLGGACCLRIRADAIRVIRGRYGETDRATIHLRGGKALRLMKRYLAVTLLGALLLIAGAVLLLA